MYRKICILCQQTSPKRWFGNRTMTSFCDVTNSAHQIQMTTLCRWMNSPMKSFCVRHWLHIVLKFWGPLRKLFAPLLSQAGFGPAYTYSIFVELFVFFPCSLSVCKCHCLWQFLLDYFLQKLRIFETSRTICDFSCWDSWPWHQCRINNSSKCSNCYGARAFGGPAVLRFTFFFIICKGGYYNIGVRGKLSQRAPHMLYKNFIRWKQVKCLSFCLEIFFCVKVHFTL